MSPRRMRPLSPDVADLLRAEQRAPAPSPARQAAIWARLQGTAAAAATAAASLGGGAAAASAGATSAAVAGAPASATSSLGAAVSATAAAGVAAVPASKSLLVIVLLAAAGVGVGAGTAVVGRAAKSKSEPRPAPNSAPTAAPAAQDAARTSGTAEREWPNGEQTASEAAGSRLEKRSPAGHTSRRARDGSDVAGAVAVPGRLTRVPRATVFPAAEAPARLAEEAHLLHGAHAALAAGDAQGALAGVLRHARHHPAGLLAEEREALQVRALLVLGHHTEAIARGRDFIRRYPGSVQRPAVERALAEIR